MDISKMTIEEIELLQAELKYKKLEIEEQELTRKKIEVHEKVKKILNNKDIILSLIDHNRTSCSDYNASNGYMHSVGYARCTKCHLIEVLDGHYENGEFDISINVTITKVN